MSVMRSVKNIVNNYTDAEVKVREATSNDPWGPSSTLMAEIADLTYNVVAFTEIMQMIWKRLNDHGKNWRHVYKALTVLEYIIKTGSEKVSQQCKENVFAIQTLKDFQYAEEGKDHGVNVREKAKALVALLKDDERLKNERAKALKAKERLSQSAFGIGSEGSQTHFGGRGATGKFGSGNLRNSDSFGSAAGSSDSRRAPAAAQTSTELEEARPSSLGEEELQLQLALAMSKEEAEAEERRRRQDDLKLQLALEESRKETSAAAAAPAPAVAGLQPPPLLLSAPAAGGAPQPLRAGQTAEASTTEKLLDFDLPTPKTKNDPWATVSLTTTAATAPPLAQVDPFQPLPAAAVGAAGAATDPWGSPSVATALPSQPAAPATTFDPWASGAKPQVAAVPMAAKDPWSVAAPAAAAPSSALGGSSSIRPAAAAAAAATSSSPWDVLPSASAAGSVQANGSSAAAGTPSDEFEVVFKRAAPTMATAAPGSGIAAAGVSASNGTALFDLSGMDNALNAADRKPKNPEDFLGANAKLVNLDSLVTRAPPPVSNASVFGGGSSSVGGSGYGSVHGNPFAAQQPPRPSLHQMTGSASFGQLPQSGGMGQAPMVTGAGLQMGLVGAPAGTVGFTGAGAVPYYAAGSATFVPPAALPPQQQQQSYNPFL